MWVDNRACRLASMLDVSDYNRDVVRASYISSSSSSFGVSRGYKTNNSTRRSRRASRGFLFGVRLRFSRRHLPLFQTRAAHVLAVDPSPLWTGANLRIAEGARD